MNQDKIKQYENGPRLNIGSLGMVKISLTAC